MIVPTYRLIIFTALILVPLVSVSVAFPQSSLITLTATALFIVFAAIDAAMSQGYFNGLILEFPEKVQLLRAREGKIEFCLKRTNKALKKLKIGLEYPRYFEATDEELIICLPSEGEEFFFHWPCTSLKRGSHNFEKCFVQVRSPIGFWDFRSQSPINLEIRVYPNLIGDRKKTAALFLSGSNLGIHTHRQVGQGKDFEKLREYVRGDSYDQIHWKATAKRGQPVSKVFKIELTQEIYVIIDASRLSARTIQAKPDDVEGLAKGDDYSDTMLEHFITSSLIMGSVAQRQGDLFGLITFSDRVHNFIRAKRGRGHYNRCQDAFCQLQPQTVTPDFDELFSFIGLKLRRRALLIFMTSLDDPVVAESFERNISLLSRKHVVLVNMLRPAGVHPLFSNHRIRFRDDLYNSLAGHIQWHNIMEFKKEMHHMGVRFSLLDSDNMSTEVVSQYISIKQRQLI